MKILSSLCLASFFLLTSCEVTAPYAALPIEDDAEMVTNVVVTDEELREDIRVGRAGVMRVEGTNQLKVVVPIRNVGEGELQLRVQTSFLNLEKQPIGDDTNRRLEIIAPGMTKNHTVISTKAEARDWVMRIGPN